VNDSAGARGIWSWDVVKYAVIGSLVLFAIIFLIFGYTEEGVRQQIRWSARISFTLFCMAFGAAGIHFYFKNSLSWWLRMNRRFLGISFAIVHLLHLGFIFLLQLSFHPVFDNAATMSLLAGGGAYFFVVVMALTSFEVFANLLSKRHWKLIHTLGGYWIWAVFLSTYLKRTDEPAHWVFVIVLVLIIILRIYNLIKK